MSSNGRSPGPVTSAGTSWRRSRASPTASSSRSACRTAGFTSYVAGDKIYCVHEADDEDAIREHARRGGFPANSISVIANEFGPHTAESVAAH